MAGLNDRGQWIILMGFLVAMSLFFLATIVDQSTIIGQTTAENVLDFPKSDIQDLRAEIFQYYYLDRTDTSSNATAVRNDIVTLMAYRKNAIVNFSSPVDLSQDSSSLKIHYNNGVTTYDEDIKL